MAERLRVPGLTVVEQSALDVLWTQLLRKADRNLLRSNYYDGKHAMKRLGSVVPPQYYRLGTVLGWSAKAVDMLARRCNPERFYWPDGDLDGLGMREIQDRNRLMSQIKSGAMSSLIHGTSFLVNTLGVESSGEFKSLVHVKDALSATGVWSHREQQMTSFLSVNEWDKDNRLPVDMVLYLPNLTITARKDGTWQVERQEHPWGVPADPLVYKPRVGREFGTSRISRAVMSLHDQALRTVIRMEGHMDVYSYPEFWLLGADKSTFGDQAGWEIMLGRIKALPDDPEAADPRLARADVKQFPASSPQPHLDALKQQAMLFSGEAAIPLTSLGVSDQSNPTSAESYVASREDLISEAEGATDDWSLPISRVVARALAIQNGEPVRDEWSSLGVEWRSPIYTSRAAAADAGQKQLAAVPWLAETDVGLELLGLSRHQIERAQAEKRRGQGRADLQRLVESGGLMGRSRQPTPAPVTDDVVVDDGLGD